MTTYRAPSPAGLDFGDVCTAPFFADVRVNTETRAVFPIDDKEGLLGFKAYRESTRPTRAVLTAGTSVQRAVVVSDDCALVTALGRGQQQARGRIWFAPARKVDNDGRLREIRQTPSAYGRLLLEADGRDADPWLVDLISAFAVEAASVRRMLESSREACMLHSLVPDVLDELRARWAATSVRCGPLVAYDNASHFLDALLERGVAERESEALGDAVVALAGSTWRFESSSLGAAGSLRLPDSREASHGADPPPLDCGVVAGRMLEEATAVAERANAVVEALASGSSRCTGIRRSRLLIRALVSGSPRVPAGESHPHRKGSSRVMPPQQR